MYNPQNTLETVFTDYRICYKVVPINKWVVLFILTTLESRATSQTLVKYDVVSDQINLMTWRKIKFRYVESLWRLDSIVKSLFKG